MAKCKYRDDFPLLAQGYAREGLIEEQIAKKLGVSVQTFNTYKKKFPQFLEYLKKGKAPVDIKVENSLLERALGYEYTEKRIEKSKIADDQEYEKTVTIQKHMAPDVTAQIFWLKNRRPEQWKDKHDIETDGSEKIIIVMPGD